MKIQIKAQEVLGLNQTIENIPGDKSISHRAIMIGSLAGQEITFNNFLFSEDCLNTVKIFQNLGVKIQSDFNARTVTLQGNGLHGLKQPQNLLDVGNSGTLIRLIAGLLAAQDFTSVIDGDASIRNRPMKRIIEPLSLMGAKINGKIYPGKNDIYPPLEIIGKKLAPIYYQMPIPSAQVKSAIIFASLFQAGTTVLTETLPSRDHTERMLCEFNANLITKNNQIFVTGNKALFTKATELYIPSDISSAAFFIVLGLVLKNSKLLIKNIGLNPSRTSLIRILNKMGAKITLQNSRLNNFEPYSDILVESSKIKNITIPTTDVPLLIDEFPILAILALFGEGEFKVTGAKELRVKESDRINSIATMVKAFGGTCLTFEDGFVIQGQANFRDFELDSFFDHRIAMASIIGAIGAGKAATIDNCECIQTSFPNFMEILKRLSA